MSDISFEELRQYSKQLFDEQRANMYGADGEPGLSAYDIAVQEGFVGTKQEWLDSLKGQDGASGADGKSAYELAVENGFTGTEQEFLDQLTTPPKGAYELAVENGFVGTEQEWLDSLNGRSAYEAAVDNGFTGTEQEWLDQLAASGGGDSPGDIKQSSNTPTERGYVKCDGSVYLKSQYPSLSQKLGNIIDNFDLENLVPSGITDPYSGQEFSSILTSSDGKLIYTRKDGSLFNTFYVYDLENNNTRLYRGHTNCPYIYSAVLLDDDTLAVTHWFGIKIIDISRAKMSSDGGFLPSEPADIFTWGISGNYQLVMSPDKTKVLAYRYQSPNGTNPTVFVFDVNDMSTPLQEFTDNKYFYAGNFDQTTNSVVMSTTISTERLKKYNYSDGSTEVVVGTGGTWRVIYNINNELFGVSADNIYKIDTVNKKVSLYNNELEFSAYDAFVFDNKYVIFYFGDAVSNTGLSLYDSVNNHFIEKETLDNTSAFAKQAFTIYNNNLYILHFTDTNTQYNVITKLSLYSYDPTTEFALPNEVSRVLNAESVHTYIKKEDI